LLPSFFIIGPPVRERVGYTTSSKGTILPKHIKETRFFDSHFDRGLRWYKTHFVASNWANIGEIAPTYFASREACHRIKELIPRAKIICIFRHSVERILSLYQVKRAYGMIPWSFEEAVLCEAELMESSRYASHLQEWQRAFGSEQVLPTFYDDLRDDPQAYVDSLSDFIGIPRFTLRKIEVRAIHASETMTHPRNYNRTHRATLIADWFKARGLGHIVAIVNGSPIKKVFLGGGAPFSQPSPETLQMVHAVMRPEVEELEGMVNRDLSAWKRLSIPCDRSEIPPKGAAARD
jgi:hypothetical protein